MNQSGMSVFSLRHILPRGGSALNAHFCCLPSHLKTHLRNCMQELTLCKSKSHALTCQSPTWFLMASFVCWFLFWFLFVSVIGTIVFAGLFVVIRCLAVRVSFPWLFPFLFVGPIGTVFPADRSLKARDQFSPSFIEQVWFL
jgi:hypothetical protein